MPALQAEPHRMSDSTIRLARKFGLDVLVPSDGGRFGVTLPELPTPKGYKRFRSDPPEYQATQGYTETRV